MMRIKLSDEATRPLPRADSGKVLLCAGIMIGLSLMVFLFFQRFPGLKMTGTLIFLNAFWAGTVYAVSKTGWRKTNWTFWAFSLGVSLQNLPRVFPHTFLASQPVQNIAQLLVVASFLPRLFTVVRKKPETLSQSDENLTGIRRLG